METVLHFEETASTNTVLAELLALKNCAKNHQTLPNGTVAYADFQTDGRGRQSNKWFSEKGKNLLMSILIYPKLPMEAQFQVSMWTALALSDYLRQDVGLTDVSIKWPNDIYVRDKKISGILIEHTVISNRLAHSIIGIGLNLNQAWFPQNLPQATSVYLENGTACSIPESLTTIRKRLLDYMHADPMKVHENYGSQLYLRHQEARFMVKATQEIFEGSVTEVDGFGRLLIRQERQLRCFELNEISFLP